jgi:multidrug efflux pump subunit AcrB
VARVPLPSEAKTPVITEIETDTSRAFSIFLYAKNPDISQAFLFDRARVLQKSIENVAGINNVNLAA